MPFCPFHSRASSSSIYSQPIRPSALETINIRNIIQKNIIITETGLENSCRSQTEEDSTKSSKLQQISVANEVGLGERSWACLFAPASATAKGSHHKRGKFLPCNQVVGRPRPRPRAAPPCLSTIFRFWVFLCAPILLVRVALQMKLRSLRYSDITPLVCVASRSCNTNHRSPLSSPTIGG